MTDPLKLKAALEGRYKVLFEGGNSEKPFIQIPPEAYETMYEAAAPHLKLLEEMPEEKYHELPYCEGWNNCRSRVLEIIEGEKK